MNKIIFCFFSFFIQNLIFIEKSFAVGKNEINKANENLSIMSSFFSTELFVNLGFAILTIVLTFGISKFLTNKLTIYLERTTEDGGNKEELIGVLTRATNITVLSVGFSITLGILGVDTGIFMGGIGFGLGFALKIFLTNFIGGIMMVTQGFYHNGDLIEIQGKIGKIKRINALSTAVEQFDGVVFYVPNVKFLEENVSNYHTNDKRRIEIEIGVDYDTDIVKAKKVIMSVLGNFPNIFQAPNAKIIVNELGDNGIILKIRFWIASTDKYFQIKSNVIETINLAFKNHGIIIPFPQITLSNREGFIIKNK